MCIRDRYYLKGRKFCGILISRITKIIFFMGINLRINDFHKSRELNKRRNFIPLRFLTTSKDLVISLPVKLIIDIFLQCLDSPFSWLYSLQTWFKCTNTNTIFLPIDLFRVLKTPMHYGSSGISRETNLLSEKIDLNISQETFLCSIPNTIS